MAIPVSAPEYLSTGRCSHDWVRGSRRRCGPFKCVRRTLIRWVDYHWHLVTLAQFLPWNVGLAYIKAFILVLEDLGDFILFAENSWRWNFVHMNLNWWWRFGLVGVERHFLGERSVRSLEEFATESILALVAVDGACDLCDRVVGKLSSLRRISTVPRDFLLRWRRLLVVIQKLVAAQLRSGSWGSSEADNLILSMVFQCCFNLLSIPRWWFLLKIYAKLDGFVDSFIIGLTSVLLSLIIWHTHPSRVASQLRLQVRLYRARRLVLALLTSDVDADPGWCMSLWSLNTAHYRALVNWWCEWVELGVENFFFLLRL